MHAQHLCILFAVKNEFPENASLYIISIDTKIVVTSKEHFKVVNGFCAVNLYIIVT